MTTARWLSDTPRLAVQFATTYREALQGVTVVQAVALTAIVANQRCVVIGHPLWRRDEPSWTLEQTEATQHLTVKGLDVQMSDTRQLQQHPEAIYGLLA